MFKEAKDLELIKDFFKVKTAYLKLRIASIEKEKEVIERYWKVDKDEKEAYILKHNQLEVELTDK